MLAAIGHTPVIELRSVVPSGGSARVLVKFESHNPTGSMKDRMAVAVVKGAVARPRSGIRSRW
jgi:cysteine synthase A